MYMKNLELNRNNFFILGLERMIDASCIQKWEWIFSSTNRICSVSMCGNYYGNRIPIWRWKKEEKKKKKNTYTLREQMMLILDWSYVFDRDQLISLYLWLDHIPFTRKRRLIEKDFADGGILFEMFEISCWWICVNVCSTSSFRS